MLGFSVSDLPPALLRLKARDSGWDRRPPFPQTKEYHEVEIRRELKPSGNIGRQPASRLQSIESDKMHDCYSDMRFALMANLG